MKGNKNFSVSNNKYAIKYHQYKKKSTRDNLQTTNSFKSKFNITKYYKMCN